MVVLVEFVSVVIRRSSLHSGRNVMITSGDCVVLPVNHVILRDTL